MAKRSYILWLAAFTFATAMPTSASADIVYDFSPTLCGWTNIGGGSFLVDEWFVDTYFNYGAGEHSTAILRSPFFTLNDGATTITTGASGGGASGVSFPASPLPTAAAANGFLGIALWDVTTSSYVASGTHSSSSYGISPGLFMDVTGLANGHTYAVDLIDQKSGGALPDSYLMVSDITIPGVLVPEPSTFVLVMSGLMGLAVYAWRKLKWS